MSGSLEERVAAARRLAETSDVAAEVFARLSRTLKGVRAADAYRVRLAKRPPRKNRRRLNGRLRKKQKRTNR